MYFQCVQLYVGSQFLITKSYYEQLLQKRQQFIIQTKTKKQVFLTFITNHGLVQNQYANEIIDAEVVLEDLM